MGPMPPNEGHPWNNPQLRRYDPWVEEVVTAEGNDPWSDDWVDDEED